MGGEKICARARAGRSVWGWKAGEFKRGCLGGVGGRV